jgi:CHAP domain
VKTVVRPLIAVTLASFGVIAVAAQPAYAATVRDSIVASAYAEMRSGHTTESPAGSNCNFYTGALRFTSSGCKSGYGKSPWCADFAKYVWRSGGVNSYLSDLDGWAQSFKTYGTKHGTWHARSSGYVPQPGDAITFDWDGNTSDSHPIDHVGIVTSASGGRVYLIAGNNGKNTVGTSNYSLGNGDIVGYTSPVGAGGSSTPGSYSDGTLLREPDGAISIIVGGMPYYLSAVDYAEIGSPGFVNVPAGTVHGLPTAIRDGAVVRAPNGAIYVIAGDAGYHLSQAEYAQLGSPRFVNVPTSLIGRLGRVPTDDTFLRDPATGAVYHVIGGAKYWLSGAEYTALGGPAFTNVPIGFINLVTGTAPAGEMFLRDKATGAIYQVVGGAKYWLSAVDYADLDNPRFINTVTGFINRLGAMPADGTYLRNVADGAIYQIKAGTKYHLSAVEYANLGSPDFTNTVTGFLNTIPTRPSL